MRPFLRGGTPFTFWVDEPFFVKGSFNIESISSYVDKMKGEGGRCQKISVLVHAQGIKTVHAGGGGQNMAKFCPRSC